MEGEIEGDHPSQVTHLPSLYIDNLHEYIDKSLLVLWRKVLGFSCLKSLMIYKDKDL